MGSLLRPQRERTSAPSTSPREGEQIPIIVHIAEHETLTVTAPVRKATADDLTARQNHNH